LRLDPEELEKNTSGSIQDMENATNDLQVSVIQGEGASFPSLLYFHPSQ